MATKIEQLVNDISALTLLEAAELAKALEEKYGVSGMAVAAPAASEAAAPKEEKSEFKVELIEATDKIKTIKALREVKKDLGLTEAKALVEGVPSLLAEAASKEEANAFKEKLEAVGAKVKLS